MYISKNDKRINVFNKKSKGTINITIKSILYKYKLNT